MLLHVALLALVVSLIPPCLQVVLSWVAMYLAELAARRPCVSLQKTGELTNVHEEASADFRVGLMLHTVCSLVQPILDTLSFSSICLASPDIIEYHSLTTSDTTTPPLF